MNPIAPYSFSAISHAIGAIATLIPAWVIYRSYRKDKNDLVVKYFMLYFLLFGIGGLILALVEFIFPTDNLRQGVGIMFATPFMYLGLAYFFMVSTELKFPKLKYAGFSFILVLGIAAFILNALDIRPTTIDELGFISFDSAEYVGEIFLLMFALAWLPAIAIFIYETIRNKDRFIRIRSLLLSIGLLALLIFGQMHDMVETWQGFLIADIFTVISYFIVMIGVLYHKKAPSQVTAG